MIKKLQALKAKKGFTLVELIVVIAIIGVLAAILVPTLLGVVTKSRVTSADTTAKGMRDAIDTFLTEADTAGYGMKTTASAIEEFFITCTNGTWTCTAAKIDSGDTTGKNFKQGLGTKVTWGNAASGVTNATRPTNNHGEDLMVYALAQKFPDMKSASVYAVLKGDENCAMVVYTGDTSTAFTSSSSIPMLKTTGSGDTATYSIPTVYEWDGKNAGITKGDGYITGTSPKIEIGTETPATT